jgi:hypothetical protein
MQNIKEHMILLNVTNHKYNGILTFVRQVKSFIRIFTKHCNTEFILREFQMFNFSVIQYLRILT